MFCPYKKQPNTTRNMIPRITLTIALALALALAARDTDMVLDAYVSVFSVASNARIASYGPAPAHAYDQLRVLFPPGPAADPLAAARALPDHELMRVLFKALAGHFVTGPSALRPAICTIQADPRTGRLDVSSNELNTETVLGVLCILLLLVVLGLLFRLERLKKNTPPP